METENEMQTRGRVLEGLIGEARRERLLGLTRIISLITLPGGIISGMLGVSYLVASPFENQDLRYFIGVAIGLGTSSFLVGTNIVGEDYVARFMDLVSGIRYSGERVKQYRTELSRLE